MAYSELERDRDQDQEKWACIILCESFHIATEAVPVPLPITRH